MVKTDGAKPAQRSQPAGNQKQQGVSGRTRRAQRRPGSEQSTRQEQARKTSAPKRVAERRPATSAETDRGKSVRTFRLRSKEKGNYEDYGGPGVRTGTKEYPQKRNERSFEESRSISNKLTRRPYHGLKKLDTKQMHLMFVGDPLVEEIVGRANKALNLVPAGALGWNDPEDHADDKLVEKENTLFTGDTPAASSHPRQEQRALNGKFLMSETGLKTKQRLKTLESFTGSPKTQVTQTVMLRPPVYRPLVVLDEGGGYVMGREDGAEGVNYQLTKNKTEIEDKKFREIRNKMLFQTIKLKKKEIALDNDTDKTQRLREIRKLLKEKRENEEHSTNERWNRLTFEESLPDYISKFKTKKLQDLKKYLKVNKTVAQYSSNKSLANIKLLGSMRGEEQGKQRFEGSNSLDPLSSDHQADQLIQGVIKPYIEAAIQTNSALENAQSKSELKSVLKAASTSKHNVKAYDFQSPNKDQGSLKKISGLGKAKGYSLNIQAAKVTREIQPEEQPIISDRNEDLSSSRYSRKRAGHNVHFERSTSQTQGLVHNGQTRSRNLLRVGSATSKEEKSASVASNLKDKSDVLRSEGVEEEHLVQNSNTELQKTGGSGQQEANNTRSEKQATPTEVDLGQMESVEDLDDDEIFEVENFLERLRVFFLAYYSHCSGGLLGFLQRGETRETVGIIKKLTRGNRASGSRSL